MSTPAPNLSAADERVLAKLRELAQGDVVEGRAGVLAKACGYPSEKSDKALRERVNALAVAGRVVKLSRQGSRFLRLRLTSGVRAPEVATSGLDLGPSGVMGGRGAGRSSSSLALEPSTTAAAAAAAAVVPGERPEAATSGLDFGPLAPLLIPLVQALVAFLDAQTEKLAPKKVDLLNITPDEERAVAERFAQARESGESIKSRPGLRRTVIEGCRTKPGELQAHLDSADRRAAREAEKVAERRRLEEERRRVQQERVAQAEEPLDVRAMKRMKKQQDEAARAKAFRDSNEKRAKELLEDAAREAALYGKTLPHASSVAS